VTESHNLSQTPVLCTVDSIYKGAIVCSKQQSWNLRNQNLPKLTFPNLSAPFHAFSCLFTPREKLNPQPNFKNKPKSQTIFSDRGYRRKIATEHNQQNAAETRKPHLSTADSNRKDSICNKQKPNPNKKLISPIKQILRKTN
jgi:hypothetical protein